MIVLGIHHGHDSSAAIVKDGVVIADVAEERFARLKHCKDFPLASIDYCLQAAGLESIRQVDRIACSNLHPTMELCAVLGYPVQKSPRDALAYMGKKVIGRPASEGENFKKSIKFLVDGIRGEKIMEPYSGYLQLPVYKDRYKVDPDKVVFMEHHLAHAASAYFTQPRNENSLIVTMDGSGNQVCTAVWQARGSFIRPVVKYFREASVGWSYSAVTEALGWWHGDGEGKTMGLAPYGDYSRCPGVLDKYFPEFDGKDLRKPSDLSKAKYWYERASTQFHLDEARDIEKLADQYGKENIAAEAQRKLESCVTEFLRGWIQETKIPHVAFSGGVFLSVKLNQRIWEMRNGLLDSQHIFPNAGDSGLAVGAALYAYYQERPFEGGDIKNLYWGPEYTDAEIENTLKAHKLEYQRCENAPKEAAELLAADKIVAWFQGRMESGPRALGNRSILMSPLKAENKDIINAEVKFREAFRPFCPSLHAEKRDVYLKNARDEYFMITSFDVTPEKKDKIPSVVHVDGTLRPQLVLKSENPRYWDLIDRFGELTDEYVILNTSFNIKGEPIIQTPREAIQCFFTGGLDALFLGNFKLVKKGA